MTVQITSIPTSVSYAVGTTPQSVFAVPFPFDDTTDIVVLVGGLPVAFAVTSPVIDAGIYTSANITLGSAVASTTVLIYRQTANDQQAVFPTSGRFGIATLNREISRIWMAAQDVFARVGDAISRPAADRGMPALVLPDATTRASRYLGFDGQGNPVALGLTTLPIGISAGWVDATAAPYSAKGDNVTDDTAAINAALATGRSVYLPGGKTFKISGSLTMSANGQKIFGDGPYQSNLRPVGNFNVFKARAYEGNGVSDLYINAVGMTGGFVIDVDGANRVLFENLRIDNCYNWLTLHYCNCADFRRIVVQGPRGTLVIYLYGTTALRSDVIRFADVNVGGDATCTWDGIVIDGCVNTVELSRVTFVNYKRGMITQNTMGGLAPQFIVASDLQFDFGSGDTLQLTEGNDFWFHQLYAQGAGFQNTTPYPDRNGIVIGANVAGVKFADSYIAGSTAATIVIGGQDILFSNCQVLLPGFIKQIITYDCVTVLGTAKRIHFAGGQYGGRKGVGLICRYAFTVAAGAESVGIVGPETYGCMYGSLLDNTASIPGNVVMVAAQQQAGAFVNEIVNGWEVGTRDGSQAQATATVTAGIITGLALSSGGRRYRSPPTVLFWDPAGTGTGASATAVVANGVVTGFTGLVGGTGYGANTKVELRSVSVTPTMQASWPGLPDVPATMRADGQGVVVLGNTRGTGLQALALDIASVNYVQARGRATGASPDIIAAGADTDLDLGLIPKGAGRINLSGVTTGTAGSLAGYLRVRINGSLMVMPYYNP